MIILGGLLRAINNNERITIAIQEEETGTLLDRWYGTPSLLLRTKEIKGIRCARVDEVKVDTKGEIVIKILFGTEG